jgi:hypothetical protein
VDRLPHIPWLTAAATPARHALSDRQTRQIVALLADQFKPIAADSKRVRAVLALVALGIFALLIHDRALNGSLPAFPIGEAEIGSHTSGVGKMNHNTVRALAAGMMSVGIATVSANAQSAVQWRVEDGGNGHWYGFIPNVPVNREAMLLAASASGAQLIVITSAQEQMFVQPLFSDGFVLGLAAPAGSPIFSWMIAEPLVYTCWGTAACDSGPYPNNPITAERFVWSAHPPCGISWDDYQASELPATWPQLHVEWSADCNNDSIIDYGQILAGELEDLNANNIPDCCEGGVPCSCPADLDGNSEVNSIDLAIILDKFGTDGGKDYPNADVDGSGIVDAADLTAILSGWGACQ